MALLLAPKKIPIGFNFVEQESCVRLLNKPVERVPGGIPVGLVLEGVVAPIIFFDAVRLIAFSVISSSAGVVILVLVKSKYMRTGIGYPIVLVKSGEYGLADN